MTEILPPPSIAYAPHPAKQVMLPAQSRRHLGRLLAAAYAGAPEQGELPASIAALLARLEASLGRARDQADERFKTELLALTPVLRRFARSLAHDPSVADDLVQDALLRAWRNRARFELGTNMESWTFTILRNGFYTRYRRSREVQDEDGARAGRLTSLPEQEARLDLQDVQAALAQIPPDMREALVLVAVENLSYEAVAAIQGCLVGTVKSRVWRARDRLCKLLGHTRGEVGQDGVMISAAGAGP